MTIADAPTVTYGWWDQVPAHLKTKTQLAADGLKPGGPVRALIAYGRGWRAREYALYDVGEARPKQATPAQLAALEKARIARRTCAQCGAVVASPSDLSKRLHRCADCRAAAARARRARELDAVITWARALLGNAEVLILDTETTDLHGYLVEIGVIRMDGSVVFASLVNPQAPIAATHIHGITPAMVAAAPTFAELEPQLRQLLHGRTVVVYNADYDAGVIEREISRLCWPEEEALAWLVETDWGEPWSGYLHDYGGQSRWLRSIRDETWAYRRLVDAQARWWRERVDWQCAMAQYACFVGEWHDYYQDYRYQPLRGGHRAVGDCLACLGVLTRMAAARLSTEEASSAQT